VEKEKEKVRGKVYPVGGLAEVSRWLPALRPSGGKKIKSGKTRKRLLVGAKGGLLPDDLLE